MKKIRKMSVFIQTAVKYRTVLGIALFLLGAVLVIGVFGMGNSSDPLNTEPEQAVSAVQAAPPAETPPPVLPSSSQAPLVSSKTPTASSQLEKISSSEAEKPVGVRYPTDRLFITQERKSYQDGQITLRVPRLDLDVPVLGGTSLDTLKKGVGLYEYAQMPAWGNSNVSIAGHRDIFGNEFYYINTITQDDLLYLTYQDTLYTYRYVGTQIVASDDWSPIFCKEYACLTLTSCDPIGTSRNRIIVTARLIDSAPL
jgi:sortase A